jgi:hypothetical protein
MTPRLPLTVELDDGSTWILNTWDEVRSSVEWLDPDEEPEILVTDASGHPVVMSLVACEIDFAEVLRLPVVLDLGKTAKIFGTISGFETGFSTNWFAAYPKCFGYDADGRLTIPWPMPQRKRMHLFRGKRRGERYRPKTLEAVPSHSDELHRLVRNHFDDLMEETLASSWLRDWLAGLNVGTLK